MGVRENKVERYLDSEVQKVLGGETRKWTSPGHDGVMDRIVFLQGGIIWFVEVKTVDGKRSPAQVREAEKLEFLGANVTTVHGKEGVDEFIDALVKCHG